jgi:S-adenosylmethionine uptake transporter
MPQPSNLKGALLGLAGMGAFACSDATIKALGGGYNAIQIIFFAGLMTVPMVVALAMADATEQGLRPRQPRLMALRSVVVLVNSMLVTFAFATLPLAQCYAIVFTMPIFVVLMSALALREPIDLVRGAAVIAGLIGVIIALDPAGASLQWGHGAALFGALLGAVNVVIIRKTGGVERSVVMILYPLMLQLAVTAALLPLVYRPMPISDLGLTAFMALMAFFGYLLIFAAYRRAPGIVVAPMQYSQIIWAAVLGALLFDETMSTRMILGTALIIAAGLAVVAAKENPA